MQAGREDSEAVRMDGRAMNGNRLDEPACVQPDGVGPQGEAGMADAAPADEPHGRTGTTGLQPARVRPSLPVRLRATGRRLAFAMFPGLCRFCDQPTGTALDLCTTCAGDLPWLRVACRRCGLPRVTATDNCPNCAEEAPRLTRTVAAFAYRAPLDRLIADIKFHGRLATVPLLASLLAEVLLRAYPLATPQPRGAAAAAAQPDAFPEALIPIPLSNRRLLQRGHDQAWMLAARLHDALAEAGRPLHFDGGALRRVRHTPAQSGQRHGARLHALVGAFAVRDQLPHRHVALLDDVFTTGATLDAAAHALQSAGVTRVDAWVIARTPGAVQAHRA